MQYEPNDPVSGEAAVTPTSQSADVTGSSTATPTNGFRTFVRRRELVIFFVLSYLIAWSTLPFGGFLAFGPLVSAIVVVLIAEGLPGLARLGRRIIRWRVNWIWYVAAIGVPILVVAVAIGLNMAAGAPPPSFDQFRPWYAVLLVFGLAMVNPPRGAFGRGARLARLRCASPAIEVVTVGVSGSPGTADYGLAFATGFHAAV